MGTKQVLFSILAGITLAVLGLALQASPALAAPAAPVDIPVTQPDGSTFTARGWGDEHQHGMETLDGYTILRDDASGYWVYAAANDGALGPALSAAQRTLVVGRDAPAGLQPHARPAAAVEETGGLSPSPALEGEKMTPNSGQQPLLVIFVNFLHTKRTYPLTDFEQKAFGASGSITDYYKKASFNQLEITRAAENQLTNPAGMVEVTLPYDHPGYLIFPDQIVIDALTAADPYVDFAQFDRTYGNNDDYVSSSELHILLLLAGYEASYCGDLCPGVKVWGSNDQLGSSDLVLDGVRPARSNSHGDRGGYITSGEIHGLIGGTDHAATIGIMVHEIGHDLSWPDLYDNDHSSSGVGRWSIMSSGSWNGGPSAGGAYSGDRPAMPDAWLKWYQGWIVPTPAVYGQAYALDQANANADALLLGSNPGGVDWDRSKQSGTGEYWLVENRQLSGYDAGLPGCGILIWHIDETRSAYGDANREESRRLVDLEQADGLSELNVSYGNAGDAGDPYPGSTFNTSFSHTSNPKSLYYSGLRSRIIATILTTGCAASMNVSVDFLELPNQLYLPAIHRQKLIEGRVTFKGAAASGETIILDAYSISTGLDTLVTATTDANGYYRFSQPDLSLYSDLSVGWKNDTGRDNYLWYWSCDKVDDAGDTSTCDFDISDILLTNPAVNGSVNLPYTFQWMRRTTSTDNYQLIFLGPFRWDFFFIQNLGWVSGVTIRSLDPDMHTDYPYRWFVGVEGPNGHGESLYERNVTFLDRDSPALNASTSRLIKRQPGDLERMLAEYKRRETIHSK